MTRRTSTILAGATCLFAFTAIGIYAAQNADPRVGRLGEIAAELEALRDADPSLPADTAAFVTRAIQNLQKAIGTAQQAEQAAIDPQFAKEIEDHDMAAHDMSAMAGAQDQTLAVTAAAAAAPVLYGGVISAEHLGTCTAAVHDRFVLDGGDGFKYRTWHAQIVPVNANDPGGTKCTFGHEHGDDPSKQTNAKIRAVPLLFGFVGRRMPSPEEPNGHDEAHEGFKVFVANKGQKNNEGRTYLHDSRFMLHMGTGGPKRFTTRFHTMQYILQTSYAWVNIQTMTDSGGVDNICAAPRQGKTVMRVNGQACKVDSLYEIWEVKSTIRTAANKVILQATASAAAFDPITIFDPANPLRVVYTWSTEVNPMLNWPNNNRSFVRGCDREAYHGPTWWDNGASNAKDVYYTDGMGKEIANGPNALKQEVSKFRTTSNFVATNDGLAQFKIFSKQCKPGLSYKN